MSAANAGSITTKGNSKSKIEVRRTGKRSKKTVSAKKPRQLLGDPNMFHTAAPDMELDLTDRGEAKG